MCPYRKSNPSILMMESAQDGERFDASGSLNRARNRRILVQGSMRSDVVVVACHVPGDARLRDLKPELEQFAVNARRAPPGTDRLIPSSAASSAASLPPMHHRIMVRSERESTNEIARFGVLKLQILAISNAPASEKQTPAQSLRGLFTDD
jgi:hypothetical protein